MLLTLAPILTFWMTAMTFNLIGLDASANLFHTRNKIQLGDTIARMIQIDCLHLLTTYPMEIGLTIPIEQVYGIRWWYILAGIPLMDTIQYFAHRFQHEHPWFYRNFHYGHHNIRETFSFGSLYNSVGEVIFTGSIMGFVYMILFKFTFQEFQIVSSLAIFWTVMDHTAYFNDVWWLGRKNFHNIHHSIQVNCNYQQPFMTFWDEWLGTDYETVSKRQ